MTEQELIDFICKDKDLENKTMEIMFYSDFRKRKRKHQLRGISFNERCVVKYDNGNIEFIKKEGSKYPNSRFIDKKDWTYFLYIREWTLEELYEYKGVERTIKTVKDWDTGGSYWLRSKHTYSYKGKHCSILK